MFSSVHQPAANTVKAVIFFNVYKTSIMCLCALHWVCSTTCLWMILRRKSGFRLRQRRWPKCRDWLRLFTCSWTCGGGRRGGPLRTDNSHESMSLQWRRMILGGICKYIVILLWVQACKLRQQQTVALCNGLFGGGCCQVALEGQNLLFLPLRNLQLPVDHLRLCVLISNGARGITVVTTEA